ncbi:MAG TPA: hypothetical protein VFO11_08750 [Candidatus Polarisedimenticolaceae bacterium]|nr:hypothetical protein [Candidatus Polarisedimenticolaceae bacterium]
MGRGSNIVSIGFVEFPPPAQETPLPEVWLQFFEEGSEGLRNLMVGEEVQLLTWFIPKGIKASVAASKRALRVHRVWVIEKEPTRLRVRGLEPQQGMAILEVTSVLERGAGH